MVMTFYAPTNREKLSDVRRHIMPQMIQEPLIVLPIEVPHVVLEGPLQFAVGLRVVDRGVDDADAEVPAEGPEEFPAEMRAVVEQHGLGNHLPRAHGRHHPRDGRVQIILQGQVTEDVPARIVILEGQLERRAATPIRKFNFFHVIPVPQTMGMAALIELPHRWSWWR
jgi:hypothetical protein